MDKEFYKNLKVANYNRKSSEAEDRQVLSIESQKDEAKKLCESLGIYDIVSYQDAKSAKTAGGRADYSNLLQDLKAGKRDAIACWKPDRLARNMLEGGEIITLLQLGIIKVIITPQRSYWPSDNVLLLAIEFGLANQFSRDLSVNVKRGQSKKARMGIPHGLAAIGFTNDKSEEKGNRKWLVDKLRFPIVKKLLHEFLTGKYSGGQIYEMALALGLTTPKHKRNGGKPIVLSRIYEILKDPIFAGFFHYGGQRYELDANLPRMITEDEHYKILRMLSGRNMPKTQTHQSIYGGFVKSPYGEFIGTDFKYQIICECKHKFSYLNKTHCPKCGQEINLIKNPTYLEYEFYYNVPMKKRKAPVKYVSQKEITDFLFEFADKFTLSPALAKWSRKYIHELHDAEVESNLAVAESQKERKENLVRRKKKLRDLLADEVIEREEYEHDKKEIEAEEAKMEKGAVSGADWLQKAENIIDLGLEMKKIVKDGTIAAKREVLSKLGANLIWDEKELFISNIKPIQILIDGLEWAKQKNPKSEPKNILDTSEQNSDFEDIRPILLRG